MSFILKFQVSNFNALVEALLQIQGVNPKNIEMKYETHIKLVHELHSTCI